MSEATPSGGDYHVVAPPAHAGLTCRFLLGADFTIADLPEEQPDFSRAATFMPLAIAVCPYGPMVFTVAARPSFDDGAVAQWLDYLLREEGYEPGPIAETRVGALPGVTGDAVQTADDGAPMQMRFVLLEDGGRLFQLSAIAPQALWASTEPRLSAMLASFELQEVRGTAFALLPGQAPPAAPSSGARLSAAEIAALALADDAASLDPDHRVNANLRDAGAGLVPRIAEVDLAGRWARVGAGAVEGFFRLPLGWHAIDDGKRVLIFDAGGAVQVSLGLREHEGLAPAAFARACLDSYLERQPELDTAAISVDGIEGAGVRAADIDGTALDQYFLVRDVGRPPVYLVAKVTAAGDDAKRALDLAGDVLATFESPATGS